MSVRCFVPGYTLVLTIIVISCLKETAKPDFRDDTFRHAPLCIFQRFDQVHYSPVMSFTSHGQRFCHGCAYSTPPVSVGDQRGLRFLFVGHGSLSSVRSTLHSVLPLYARLTIVRYSVYGVSVLQAYMYFKNSRQDSKYLRSFVSRLIRL